MEILEFVIALQLIYPGGGIEEVFSIETFPSFDECKLETEEATFMPGLEFLRQELQAFEIRYYCIEKPVNEIEV